MPDRGLSITARADGPRLTLHLDGELDLASVGTLRACLESIDDIAQDVCLDLTDLRFLDSTGIGAIVAAHHSYAPTGRQLTLDHPTGHVAKVIDLAGLATIIPVSDASP